MTILAVDTTSEFGSVALRRGGKTVAEARIHSNDGFGHLIVRAVQEVLARANTKLEEIDCFAGASGPGSFTGVRVGLAAIKGLAEVMHKPAASISNLRALSLAGHQDLRATVLDARREQIYGALYDASAELIDEESVMRWERWFPLLPAGAELIGIEGGPCEAAGKSFTKASPYLAPAVAECAERDGAGKWVDPIGIDANYVRRSDAEMFWKDA